MLGKLYEATNRGYEAGIYRANPCDLGTARWLRPFGRALRHLGSECGCCSGARVLAVAIGAAVAPMVVATIIGVWFLAALVKEIWSPTQEHQDGYDAYDEGAKP